VRRALDRVMGRSQQNAIPESTPVPSEPPPPHPRQPRDRRVVAIGADHGGFELKAVLRAELTAGGYEMIDIGTHHKEAVDYPDFALQVAKLVGSGTAWRGIVIDGAGIGSCIVANKVPGVRAGLAYDHASAANSRAHSDTNVLALGAGLIGLNLARQIVHTWLSTDFEGGRHARRVDKITAVENEYLKGNRKRPMLSDEKTVEQLIEIITREVLVAMMEQKQRATGADPDRCKISFTEGTCVQTCFDQAGRVIGAGSERLSSAIGIIPHDCNLARRIDHTLLKADATPDQIARLCFEARTHGFAAVCVNPAWVKLCTQLLQGCPVKVCTVTGFPLGATAPEAKAFECRNAIEQGATEIDMVINIGALKARDLALVARDIRGVVAAAHAGGAIVKVIIEAVLLTDEEKTIACLLAKEAGADFVKTSTGFAGGGATVHDVELMRRVVGPELGVKAAGGVRTHADAERMLKAGATRIGTSAGVKIVQGAGSEQEFAPVGDPAEKKY
ncbi:MAG: deoxyribose-phosphate aldolase, partial [Acidobacteria bacterium]|nr:deoxyribose-phosphate aldolase [Acidobacteriota bacterium]